MNNIIPYFSGSHLNSTNLEYFNGGQFYQSFLIFFFKWNRKMTVNPLGKRCPEDYSYETDKL